MDNVLKCADARGYGQEELMIRFSPCRSMNRLMVPFWGTASHAVLKQTHLIQKLSLWIYIPSEKVIGDSLMSVTKTSGPVVPSLRYGGCGSGLGRNSPHLQAISFGPPRASSETRPHVRYQVFTHPMRNEDGAAEELRMFGLQFAPPN